MAWDTLVNVLMDTRDKTVNVSSLSILLDKVTLLTHESTLDFDVKK